MYYKPIIFMVLSLVLLEFITFAIYFHHNERKTIQDNPQTEMKKLPHDVKKHLAEITPVSKLNTSVSVPILMYHYVEYIQDKSDTMRKSLNINPNVFDQQIHDLSDAGYTFLEARDLGDVLDGKKTLPSKPIVITIDDGHWDVDTVILPILKKYKAKATAYVIPGFTGKSDFMNKSQVEDIIQSNLIEVAAHTVHHISLKNKLSSTVTYEVEESKKMLEDTYHIKVDSFAYPNGSFDLQAADIVKKAGFTNAVSTIPGITINQKNRFFLFRLRPGARTGKILLNWLASLHA